MNPDLPPNPREELEAKVTAWLLGELSAEEAASVREMIAKDAELRKLQERLSQTLNLLRETVAAPMGETPAQPAPLKLSPARREKLLAHFKTIAPKEFAPPPRRKISWLIPLAAAAAIVLAVVSRTELAGTHGTLGMRGTWGLYTDNGVESQSAETRGGPVNQPVTAPATSLPALEVPAKAPAASQIVLPQNNEQQVAQENNPQNAGITELNGSIGDNRNLGVRTAQIENRELPVTPTAAPVTVSAPPPSGIFELNNDKDSSRVIVAADDVTRSTSTLRTRLGAPSSFGGIAGGADGGGKSAVTVAKNSNLNWGPNDSVKTLNGWALKEDLEKSSIQEQSAELRPGKASQPALVATTSPAPAPEGEFLNSSHAAERMLRSTAQSADRRPVAITPIPGSVQSLPLVGLNGYIAVSNPTPSAPEAGIQDGFNLDSAKFAPATPALPPAKVARLNADGSIEGTPSTNATVTYFAFQNSAAKQGKLAGENVTNGVLAFRDGKKIEPNDAPLPRPILPAPVPQAEVLTRENAFTTFSLNISDVAFKLAQASLQNGVMPEAASMRSEEFINAFDYRDPEPAPGAPIGFAWERAGDPFAHNRDFLRFSIKTAAQGRQEGRPLNLVLLLDKSGSMERADRVEIIARALSVLASQLQPHDTLSVVVFARTARLFVDGVPGSEAGLVAKKLRDLTPEGGTNLEEAMRLAYATALRHYLANGENRVVLLTDGAANLGNVEPAALKQNVETNRKQGIALDCFGVGWDGYNDDLLETLSRAGNGRYGFINTPEEAAAEFAGKLAGALRVAAADVKVQVEFNSNRVTSYRQIGYAKDQLKKEDFRDNNVKGAQIGAAESGNALYTVEINPAGEGPVGTVHVRFRVPGTSDYQEHEWTVPYNGSAVPLEKASPAMRLAASAAAFAEWLAGSPYAGDVTPDRLLGYLNGVPQVYGADTRPQKLEWMIRQAKSISGK